MKNFVIISPHFPETYYQFAKALKKVGFRVFGIGDAPYDSLRQELKENLDEYVQCFNMENVDNEIKSVQYLQDKYGHIDYLESNNEFWLHNDAILREWFNIDTGVYPKELETWQRKSQMKERFKKAGVKCARWIIPHNKEDIVNFAKEVGYPLFVKPDIGVGAYGDYKLSNETDVDLFIKERNPNIDYICEQYITGNIVSFDGICDSKSRVVFASSHFFPPSVAEVVKLNKEFFYYTLPSVPKDLDKAGRAIVKAFGLKKRFFHFEFFRLTQDIKGVGFIGDIVALEANMRTPGGYTPDMINYANSISCYDLYAEVMMFDKTYTEDKYPHFYCGCASRRDGNNYVIPSSEIVNEYYYLLCNHGRYPDVLAGDMGNEYFIGKFKSIDDMITFRSKVEKKY